MFSPDPTVFQPQTINTTDFLVKGITSSQPEPATMPIYAYHHPTEDNNTLQQEDYHQSGSSNDWTKLPNLSNGSFSNEEVGLSFNSPPVYTVSTHGFNMMPQHHMMQMDNHQFEMYPNESAPHVTQVMDISSHNTSGEFSFADQNGRIVERNQQSLPSFAHIQAHLFNARTLANVGETWNAACYMGPTNKMHPEEQDYQLLVPSVTHQPVQPEEHTMMNKYVCGECKKVFSKASYRTQHNRAVHSGEKPFRCSKCGKRFPDEACYDLHISKHEGGKPHKCKMCPKEYQYKTDLRRHMYLHGEQKPYLCNTCGKGFIRNDHLMKHSEIHG